MEAKMKDNNLTHKFWARAVAFCLFCATAAVLACCIAGVVYCYSKEWYKTGLNVTFTTEGDEWDYAIDGTNAIMTDKTGFKEFAYKNRNSMMVYGFIAGITALACFVFLLCSAAHRSGTEDCVLLRQDKMPYDLYLPSAILLGTGLCAMLVECVAYELNTVKAVAAALIMACLAGVFMALCMTTAARIKTGTLFKNTLIYRLCTGVGMGASSMLSSISGAWRFSLAFAGYLLINALLSYRFFTRGGFLVFLLLIAVNGGALYFLLNMIRQMRTLSAAGQAMANGDLSYCVDTSDMKREFREHGENLNSIGRGMAIAVNERMKSERFKTELITNVSHDLKTPLTSIVTYIDLLQKEDIQDEKAKEYINTIARQSKKLKKLTEDLIDASKASSGALNVNMERVNISELLRQSSAEYGERMEAVNITPVVNMPEEDIYVRADGRLLWRVVENLLQNICRHGMPGTRAYLEARTENGRAVVCFKNISQQQLNIPVEELLERFVQGDESRSRGGSGLGLSIAESLTELMKGKLKLSLDGDLFKVELWFDEDKQ
jgi:signal transduction histidine kinase